MLSYLQEIAGPLEASVSASGLTPVTQEQQPDNSLQLQLQPSLAVWHALQRWDTETPCPSICT